jgi:hypothetical protein
MRAEELRPKVGIANAIAYKDIEVFAQAVYFAQLVVVCLLFLHMHFLCL